MQLAFSELNSWICFVNCPNDEVAMGKQSFGAFSRNYFSYFSVWVHFSVSLLVLE